MAEVGLYVLSSLLGMGYLLNQNKQARQPNDGNMLQHNDKTVGTDIYNSRDYYKGKQEEFDRATKNWNDAKNPKVTGVIPMYYNTLQVKEDYEKVPNAEYDGSNIYGVLNYLDGATQAKIKASSIHDSARAPSQEWGIVMDRPLPSAMKEGQDPLQQIGGSLVPGQEDFTHNNMVPFYKSTITQDMRTESQGKVGKLELFTGQFKLNKEQKEEVGPMFKPMAENIYGTQIYRDLSRFNPNNTGKKNNETPIEKMQVGPGLGQGFTNLPSGGKHETLRIMPKGIEQLRVDPVTETEAKTASGASRISKRALISQLYRNRPELLVTNHNGERNFTTMGDTIAPMSQPTVVLRNTRRKKSRIIQGAARASSIDGPRIAPESKESTRINFENTPFRNVAAQERMVSDYGRDGYVAYDNNRMTAVNVKGSVSQQGGADVTASEATTSPDNWVFGGTQTIMQLLGLAGQAAPTVKVQDKAKQTRKEFYEANPRSLTGNSRSGPAKAPSYNPKEWVAKKTIRETTGDTNHVGHASGIQKKHITISGQKARKTIRETTEDNSYIAPANSYTSKTRSYDSAYNARTNTNKEVVAQGRAPTNRGPNLGYQNINMEAKKLEEDRENKYVAVKTSTVGNSFNPKAVSFGTVTSEKNNLPVNDTRLDTGILDAYKRNPLAQSLSSWA